LNIASNPWSFVSADVVTAAPSASPTGLISSAGGVVAYSGAAFAPVPGNFVTIIGATNALYNGFYKVLAVGGGGTTATLYSDKLRYAGTVLAASGGGTIIKNQYQNYVRAEDMYWLNATAASEAIVLDKNGNLVWDAIAPTTGNYSRSKPYWINGLTIQALPSGTLTVTVN